MRRHIDRWQVIVLVDQSGSMADSVIHAAVTASIFTSLETLLKTHLAVFDTNVVDLTDTAADPVETLMKVQLGGGTDIGHALRWAEGIIERPDRAIIVLISDFYEGAGLNELLRGRQAAGRQRRDACSGWRRWTAAPCPATTVRPPRCWCGWAPTWRR